MKKAALLFCSILVSLLVVETALRWSAYDINSHPYWTYDSKLGWVVKPDAHFDQVNSSGFRHLPVTAEKPSGTKRVLVLGDSFTLAASFNYSKTFPGVLGQLLRQRGRWEVVALAVDDWGWPQQLIALESIGFDCSPDVVVSQLFPLNDFCNNCLVMANTCSMQDQHRPYFILQGDHLQLTSLNPVRKALREQFRLVGLLENLVDDPWAQAREISGDESEHPDLSAFFKYHSRLNGLRYTDAIQSLLPPEHQQPELKDCWKISERILARMASDTADRGVSYLAAVIPFLYTFEERWEKLFELSAAPIDPLYATTKTERILAALNVPVVSMRARILAGTTPSEEYFISLTDGHLSEFGHAQLARWVIEEMENQGLIED